MNNKTYRIISRFECCNTTMVTVIMERGNASVMSEREYNRIMRQKENTEKDFTNRRTEDEQILYS